MADAAYGLALSWPARTAVGHEPVSLRSRATELAMRARAGDDRAFDELMRATEERVLAVAWRLLGTREDARDATQETFLRVYRYLGRFRAGHDFEAWLYRIAVNVCRDLYRRERAPGRVRLDSSSEKAPACEPWTASEAEGRVLEGQRRSLVLRALATLPLRQRAAVVLRDLEGKTSDEVAAILGTRPGTVRAQLAIARIRLRAAIVRFASETPGSGR